MAKVEIYTTPFCPFCHHAKRLLDAKGVAFTEINVMMNPVRKREMIERAGGGYTVPQIFIDDRRIGGCDEIYALDSEQRLDPLLKEA